VTKVFQCQVVGAGPAGLSFLIALCNRIADQAGAQNSRLQALLDSLVILDADKTAGGVMADYQINANTDSVDVVRGIADNTPFSKLRDDYLQLPETRQALIPLPDIGGLLIRPMVEIASNLLGERLRCNSRVKKVIVKSGEISSLDESHQTLVRSKTLVLCCGGREELIDELSSWRDKTHFGTDFLRLKGIEALPKRQGCIVIIGSSHSSFSAAWRLLHDPLVASYATGKQIYILQRSELVKLRCSPEFADAHALPYDVDNDICPVTGLVYRNAGLRKDARDLYLQMQSGKEKRVKLLRINELSEQGRLLDDAALVVQCVGFQACFPEIEVDGKSCRIEEKSKLGELRDADSGEVIPGLYGYGLGVHILPEGEARGEKSFTGSPHGLLTYPLAIAPEIIDQLLSRLTEAKPALETI
jgi:hypothetical protein